MALLALSKSKQCNYPLHLLPHCYRISKALLKRIRRGLVRRMFFFARTLAAVRRIRRDSATEICLRNSLPLYQAPKGEHRCGVGKILEGQKKPARTKNYWRSSDLPYPSWFWSLRSSLCLNSLLLRISIAWINSICYSSGLNIQRRISLS